MELIEVQEQFQHLFEQLMKCGWNVKSDITYIEDNDAHRIHIKQSLFLIFVLCS